MKYFGREHFDLAYKYLKEERGLEKYSDGDLDAALIRTWTRYKKENPMAGYEDLDLNNPFQRQLYEEMKAYDDDGLDEDFADVLERYSNLERSIDERRACEEIERQEKQTQEKKQL